MNFSHEVTIPVAAEVIDLPDWLFTLSEEDYAACQRGHRAIGFNGGDRRTGMVNVESIGGSLLIQHYATRLAEKHHVTMVSTASRDYLMHLVPVTCGVTWDMTVRPAEAGSLLRCDLAVDPPSIMRVLGPLTATAYFVRRHLAEETRGFARDIARKLGPHADPTAVHDAVTASD